MVTRWLNGPSPFRCRTKITPRWCRRGSFCAPASSSTSAGRSMPRGLTSRWKNSLWPTSVWKWSRFMSASRAPRRLPGFRFETQAPTLPEVLPRMDVTVFVGFSASGPLQVPVAVESEAQFTAIFGQDAPLAVDVERSEQVYAHLAPAVRAFFRNNGRRCWVIRVARQRAPFGAAQKNLNYARYNYFPIPALARAEFANGKLKRITPAFARARSEGSWSDSLRVGSALLTRSLQISSVTMPHSESPLNDSEDYLIKVDRLTAQNLGPGDLLKMTFQDDQKTDRSVLFLVAAKADPAISGTPDPTVDIIGRKAVWFEIVSPIS